MKPVQCKMARVALNWTTDDLAEAAEVGRMTVARFERGDRVSAESVEKMQNALDDAGVIFHSRDRRVGVMVVDS